MKMIVLRIVKSDNSRDNVNEDDNDTNTNFSVFFFGTKIPTFHPLSLFALPGPFSPSSDVLKPAVDVCT